MLSGEERRVGRVLGSLGEFGGKQSQPGSILPQALLLNPSPFKFCSHAPRLSISTIPVQDLQPPHVNPPTHTLRIPLAHPLGPAGVPAAWPFPPSLPLQEANQVVGLVAGEVVDTVVTPLL